MVSQHHPSYTNTMLFDEHIEIQGVTYHFDALIGEGTSGAVWTVSSPQGRKFALKIIYDYGRNPILKQLVNQEIATQQKFRNNYFIINIYGSKYITLTQVKR